jgi:hypothetical protein
MGCKLYIPIGNIKHGDVVPGRVGRYCEVCQVMHGYLFECKHYTSETIKQIRKLDRQKKSQGVSIAIAIIFFILLMLKYK